MSFKALYIYTIIKCYIKMSKHCHLTERGVLVSITVKHNAHSIPSKPLHNAWALKSLLTFFLLHWSFNSRCISWRNRHHSRRLCHSPGITVCLRRHAMQARGTRWWKGLRRVYSTRPVYCNVEYKISRTNIQFKWIAILYQIYLTTLY